VGTKTTKANGTGRESLAMTVAAHSECAGQRSELWLGDWESQGNWQRIMGRNSFIVENGGHRLDNLLEQFYSHTWRPWRPGGFSIRNGDNES
jgi:hypothetical protein